MAGYIDSHIISADTSVTDKWVHAMDDKAQQLCRKDPWWLCDMVNCCQASAAAAMLTSAEQKEKMLQYHVRPEYIPEGEVEATWPVMKLAEVSDARLGVAAGCTPKNMCRRKLVRPQ